MSKPNEDLWGEVDKYITATIPHNDAALEAAIEANRAGGLPAIDVSAPQGKLLHLLTMVTGARRVLEV
ncbi:MAG TPA: hypothetical protein VN678_07610, partial [Acidobacteriaceae bacterium]|nr:hypothetical protein [Acidobacteriaceae bacterium]